MRKLERWDSAARYAAVRDSRSAKQEVQVLFRLATPIMVQAVSHQAMALTDQIFLGHLGTDEMAAGALGNMYAAFLTFFLLGTATALDTLGSQAYGAAKLGSKGTSLVTWCFTSFVVLTLLCAPVTVGLMLGYPVARGLLGQDHDVARLVEEYCAGLIPGIWPMMWSVVLMKYLQVQNVVLAPAVVAAATFVLNIGANFLFIHLFGFKGAPWATSFSRLLQFLALAAMVYLHQYYASTSRNRVVRSIFTRPDFSSSPSASFPNPFAEGKAAAAVDAEQPTLDVPCCDKVAGGGVQGGQGHMARYIWQELKASVHPALLWTYLKHGLPGGVMMACGQGVFGVTTMMAGYLGPVVVSAHSAMLQATQLTHAAIPFAAGAAGSIRVGELLGDAMPHTARKAGWLSVSLGGAFMLACFAIILGTKDVIGRMFTTDSEVIAIMAMIAPIAASYQVPDGLMGCCQGVLRGCGKQRLLMIYNIVGFWLSGLLLGYLLCFQAGMGVHGLWVGIAVGNSVAGALSLATLARMKWGQESAQRQQFDEDAASKHLIMPTQVASPSSTMPGIADAACTIHGLPELLPPRPSVWLHTWSWVRERVEDRGSSAVVESQTLLGAGANGTNGEGGGHVTGVGGRLPTIQSEREKESEREERGLLRDSARMDSSTLDGLTRPPSMGLRSLPSAASGGLRAARSLTVDAVRLEELIAEQDAEDRAAGRDTMTGREPANRQS